MVQQVKNFYERLGVWATLVTFAAGFLIHAGINLVTNANRLDFLTEKVAEQGVKIDKLGDKIDTKSDKQDQQLFNHESRISILEGKAPVKPAGNRVAEN
ncbi:MAG: hypothetical protein ACXVIY_05930 [Mucilaginibacter sp.]